MTIFFQHIFKTEPDYRCIEYRTLGSRSIEVVTWPKGGRGRLIVSCERQTFSSLIAAEGRFLLAKRPSKAMSEEKRLPFAG